MGANTPFYRGLVWMLTLSFHAALVIPAFAQGETTSAIIGQVTDATGAAIASALVAIENRDTGLRRDAKADEAGRFDFPQLKPGRYSVRVDAEGFESQQNMAVLAGLGQKQTVDFALKVAPSKQTVEISGSAPLIDVQ